jgi:hypothetical protein
MQTLKKNSKLTSRIGWVLMSEHTPALSPLLHKMCRSAVQLYRIEGNGAAKSRAISATFLVKEPTGITISNSDRKVVFPASCGCSRATSAGSSHNRHMKPEDEAIETADTTSSRDSKQAPNGVLRSYP